jgi:hypothetical protein
MLATLLLTLGVAGGFGDGADTAAATRGSSGRNEASGVFGMTLLKPDLGQAKPAAQVFGLRYGAASGATGPFRLVMARRTRSEVVCTLRVVNSEPMLDPGLVRKPPFGSIDERILGSVSPCR